MFLGGKSHAPVTVTDTATLNLTIGSDQSLSGEVIPGGIDHGSLAGLTDVADHPGYLTLDGTRAMTGDLSLGGNDITNVYDLTMTHFLTAPFIFGSAASGGNLQLISTQNATKGNIYLGNLSGTQFAVFSEANNALGIGDHSFTPTNPIHLSFNTGKVFLLETYSASAGSRPGFVSVRADGTASAPTNTKSGMFINEISGWGHDGNSFVGATRVGVRMRAAADWSPTSNPTEFDFTTTPVGSTNAIVRYVLSSDGDSGFDNMTASEIEARMHVRDSVSGAVAIFEQKATGSSTQVMTFRGNNKTAGADNDTSANIYQLRDDTGANAEFARFTWIAEDVTSSTKDGGFRLEVMRNNSQQPLITGSSATGVTINNMTWGYTGNVSMTATGDWEIAIDQASSGDGNNFTLKAGDGFGTGDTFGGNLVLQAGLGNGVNGEDGEILLGNNLYFQYNGADLMTIGRGIADTDSAGADMLILGGEADDASLLDLNGGNIYVAGGPGVNSGTDGNIYLAYDPDLGGSVVGNVGIGTTTLTSGRILTVVGGADIDTLEHSGTTLGFFGTTPTTRASAYTVSNGSTDRSYDANATTINELADVLGTLIADLKSYGLLQ